MHVKRQPNINLSRTYEISFLFAFNFKKCGSTKINLFHIQKNSGKSTEVLKFL